MSAPKNQRYDNDRHANCGVTCGRDEQVAATTVGYTRGALRLYQKRVRIFNTSNAITPILLLFVCNTPCITFLFRCPIARALSLSLSEFPTLHKYPSPYGTPFFCQVSCSSLVCQYLTVGRTSVYRRLRRKSTRCLHPQCKYIQLLLLKW